MSGREYLKRIALRLQPGGARRTRVYVVATTALAYFVCVGLLWHFTRSRIDADQAALHRQAGQEAAALASAYAQHVEELIGQIDQISLRVQRDWLRARGRVDLTQLAEAGAFRGARLAYASIVNARGERVASSWTRGSLRAQASPKDRGYFAFHKQDTSNVLLIGTPVLGDVGGRQVVQLTRRLSNADGSFAGVIVVSVAPSLLTSFFTGSHSGKAGLLAVVGNDGTVRAAAIGETVQETAVPVFRDVPLFDELEGSRSLAGKWFTDGQTRWVGWKTLSGYPLVAMAGVAEEEVFGPHYAMWATYRKLAIGGGLVLALFALLLGTLWLRLASRKQQANEVHRIYRLATEEGPEGLYILDPLHDSTGVVADFVVVDCNERGAGFLGMAKKSLLGERLSALLSPPEFDAMMGNIRDTLTLGFYEDEVRMPAASRLRIGWARRRLMRSGAGVALTLEDVTARKRAEALAELEHAVTRGLADADDSQTALRAAMRAICEAEGWACARYFQVDERAETLRFAAAWGDEDPAIRRFLDRSREITFRRGEGLVGHVWQTGESLWVPNVAADPRIKARGTAQELGPHAGFVFPIVAQGRTLGVLSFTGRAMREPEPRLQQSLVSIGRQIGQFVQRAEEREARQAAERANLAKSEFLSRMSHELRTPLNAILGFAQVLELDSVDERQRDSLKEILRAGEHLLQLISDLLDLSRIESGHLSLTLEALDPCKAIDEALALVTPMLAQANLALERELDDCGDTPVMADTTRLLQVLVNLLTNSVKYNRPGGGIRVRCESSGADGVRIKVTDSGRGIAPENMARLFEPFERLGAEASEVEGVGIGLALSKRLVEMMGGTIGASSVPGEGSSFWIELPRAPRSAVGKDAPRRVRHAAGRGRSVLYIEDNPVNVRLIERVIERLPEAKLLVALSGQAGLELARAAAPDLILLDIHLPDIDGFEILGRLRADPKSAAVPVFALSADALPHEVQRALDAGFQRYVTKPINVAELLEMIGAALSAQESG